MMFELLMSRCTTLRSCAYSSARQTWPAIKFFQDGFPPFGRKGFEHVFGNGLFAAMDDHVQGIKRLNAIFGAFVVILAAAADNEFLESKTAWVGQP